MIRESRAVASHLQSPGFNPGVCSTIYVSFTWSPMSMLVQVSSHLLKNMVLSRLPTWVCDASVIDMVSRQGCSPALRSMSPGSALDPSWHKNRIVVWWSQMQSGISYHAKAFLWYSRSQSVLLLFVTSDRRSTPRRRKTLLVQQLQRCWKDSSFTAPLVFWTASVLLKGGAVQITHGWCTRLSTIQEAAAEYKRACWVRQGERSPYAKTADSVSLLLTFSRRLHW